MWDMALFLLGNSIGGCEFVRYERINRSEQYSRLMFTLHEPYDLTRNFKLFLTFNFKKGYYKLDSYTYSSEVINIKYLQMLSALIKNPTKEDIQEIEFLMLCKKHLKKENIDFNLISKRILFL